MLRMIDQVEKEMLGHPHRPSVEEWLADCEDEVEDG
jgi:hypothetical protein